MKKMTKRNLMRALAFLMAVVMVATSGAFSSGGWLRATGIIEEEEAGVDAPVEEISEEEPAEEESEEETEEEPAEEPVQEVSEIELCAEGCTLDDGHEGECVLPQPEPEPEPEPEPVKTCEADCTLEEGHEGDCVLPQPEEEPVEEPTEAAQSVCLEGCTLDAGHEGDCVVAQEEIYTLYIKHELPAAEGTYGEKEEVTLKESDFTDGKYDALKHAIRKSGLEVKTTDATVAKDSFDANGEYTVTITYAVARRMMMMMRSAGPAGTTYLGSISDLEITEKQTLIVTLKFKYDSVDGAQAAADMPIMVELSDDGKYYFNETIELPEGYLVSIHNDAFTLSGNTVSATLGSDTSATDVVIVFAAKDADYKVVTKTQKTDGTYETSETKKTGKVGDLTEAITEEKAGFTLSAGQEVIKADGSTVVEVQYDRLVHYINYNTMGGSYIPSKSGLHGSEATVYEYTEGQEGSEGHRVTVCETEEHSHSNSCWSCKGISATHWWHSDKCKVVCGREEHKHSENEGCYEWRGGSESIPNTWNNPAAPTRAGYTFTGWYTDAACTTKASEKAVLEGDITVYAGWEATEVTYTVVYLVENADDDNYSYFGSVTKQATAGTVVTENANGTKPQNFDSENFSFKESTSATVKADGSTVITVKYTRNIYTITWSGRYYHNGSSYRNETVEPGTGTITAKYGASITQLWKDEFNTPYPDYAWNFTTNNNDKFVSIDTMPSGDKTVHAFYFSVTKVQTLHYWLEGYTGPGVETKTKDGVTYGLYKAQNVKFNYLYENSEFYEIVGYKKGSYEGCKFGDTTKDKQQVHFYYLANSYALDLYGYNGEKLSSHSVKLNSDITSYLKAPETSINGAVFSGWYVDPAHK